MNTYSFEKLDRKLKAGHVYRRDMLSAFSTAVDRDLGKLVAAGRLKKLSGGLYYKPTMSSFGMLPPPDSELVKCFLRNASFLMYSWHQYNALGLGLTQLYNRVVVLNNKRHGIFKLGNKAFDFRRSNRGFPSKITPEFLMVDLMNNINELAEDTSFIKKRILENLHRFDKNKLFCMAEKFGKVGTKHYFKEICQNDFSASAV